MLKEQNQKLEAKLIKQQEISIYVVLIVTLKLASYINMYAIHNHLIYSQERDDRRTESKI